MTAPPGPTCKRSWWSFGAVEPARRDLTGAERKAFAAEVGRLSLTLRMESHEDGESQWDSDWFRDFYDKSGLGKATAHRWWNVFTAETDRAITPKQATPEDKAFAAEVGRLSTVLLANSGDDSRSAPESRWLLELAEKSGTGKTAVYDWWRSFTAETAPPWNCCPRTP